MLQLQIFQEPSMEERGKAHQLDEHEQKICTNILRNCRVCQPFVQTSVYMCHWGQRSSENQFPDRCNPKCGKKSAIQNVEGRVTKESPECIIAYTHRVTYCRIASRTRTCGDNCEYTKSYECTHHFPSLCDHIKSHEDKERVIFSIAYF